MNIAELRQRQEQWANVFTPSGFPIVADEYKWMLDRISELESKIITAMPFEKIAMQQAERIKVLEKAMANVIHDDRCVNWSKPEKCNCYLGEVLDTLEARNSE